MMNRMVVKIPGRRISILLVITVGVQLIGRFMAFMALISLLIAGLLEAMSLLQSLFGQRFEEPSKVELSCLFETRLMMGVVF